MVQLPGALQKPSPALELLQSALSSDGGAGRHLLMGLYASGSFPWGEFFRANDRQVESDLHADRLVIDLDRRLAVEIPAERTGREFLDLGNQRDAIDNDFDRLGVVDELGAGNRTVGLGHSNSSGEQ